MEKRAFLLSQLIQRLQRQKEPREGQLFGFRTDDGRLLAIALCTDYGNLKHDKSLLLPAPLTPIGKFEVTKGDHSKPELENKDGGVLSLENQGGKGNVDIGSVIKGAKKKKASLHTVNFQMLQNRSTVTCRNAPVYALTTNVTIISLLAIFTTYRLSQGAHEIVYLLPGGVSTVMVLLIAFHVHTLRRKGESLSRLARAKAREARGGEPGRYGALRTLQAVLQEAPPEARIYGNLPVGYGLIPLLAVFVLAYTGLLSSSDSDVVLTLEGVEGAVNMSLARGKSDDFTYDVTHEIITWAMVPRTYDVRDF
ncbi:hypothetical protein C7M84_003575 [Penaeus vannamei]|uniref:Uncharacterized protein n=1 Tax=Penaeus vannamei TaxID=6689 RepID=A0A423TMR5_PENVA|nr:hypothetical protein C7M84_003575 [Penaeus vannamei]